MLGFLRRLLGALHCTREGTITTLRVWTVSRSRTKTRPRAAFRALARLITDGDCIRLEGATMAEDVRSFLRENVAVAALSKRPDALIGRSCVIHVPASAEILSSLARLCRKHEKHEVCDHVYLYRDDVVLVMWHDFPDSATLMVADVYDDDRIAEFGRVAGCQLVREANPCPPRSN